MRTSEQDESVAVSSSEVNNVDAFRLLTWNVDGLDDKNLVIRTKAVGTIIVKSVLVSHLVRFHCSSPVQRSLRFREKPDVIFLQEVVDEMLPIIGSYVDDQYLQLSGRNKDSLIPYFTLTLLRRDRVKFSSHLVLPFPTTMMGRTLLIAQV